MATDNVTQVIYSFASEISDIATVASNKKPCPLVQSSILNCCCVQSNVLSLYATPSVSSWLQPRVPAYSPTFSHVTIAFQCPLLLPLQSSWFNVGTMQSLDRRVAIRSQIALRDSFRNDWCGNRRSLQVIACEWKMLSGLRRYIMRRRTWSHAGQKDGTQSLAWSILDM